MTIELSEKEFRRLLDLVYIGDWILNSARGEDRFEDYDNVLEKLFALCPRVGMGALIGLEEWRTEMAYLAMHLRFMTKNYWKTKYSLSFPRMRPAAGGYQPNFLMSEKQFAQTLWAFRIFDHDVEISMSTRETTSMRDHFITLGVTSVSAGSHTDPGGYAHPDRELEQFHINDDRSPQAMEAMIRAQGYDVIYKDWDKTMR